MTIPGQGISYGRDVRPCNQAAEVTYAHKNVGFTERPAKLGKVIDEYEKRHFS
ncbi:hypothetical protein [Nonomuraea sp. NPDC023979]|uniref:hypothetical protein n=1 Tax=Nonomuraea sp. NPDC023979 TaxID=3154796 RepID=UPI0033DE0EB0